MLVLVSMTIIIIIMITILAMMMNMVIVHDKFIRHFLLRNSKAIIIPCTTLFKLLRLKHHHQILSHTLYIKMKYRQKLLQPIPDWAQAEWRKLFSEEIYTSYLPIILLQKHLLWLLLQLKPLALLSFNLIFNIFLA